MDVSFARGLRRLTCAAAALSGALAFPMAARPAHGQPLTDPVKQVLGRGYDAGLRRATELCLTGTPVLRGNRSGSLRSGYDQTFSELLHTSARSLSAGIDLGIIAGSASTSHYARIARTKRSTSYTIDFHARLGSVMLEEPRLTSIGERASTAKAPERLALCGNQFVSSVEVGSRLLLSLVFAFSTQDELHRFVTTVRVEALWGLASSSRRFTRETTEFTRSGEVHVIARQEGGAPTVLGSLLAAGPTRCRFDEAESCFAHWRQLLEYAGSRTAYAAQLTQPSQLDQLAILSVSSSDYAAADLPGLSYELPGEPALEFAHRDLSLQIERQQDYRRRADAIVSLQPESPAQGLGLVARDAIEQNLASLEHALKICRERPEVIHCNAARSDADARLRSILPSALTP